MRTTELLIRPMAAMPFQRGVAVLTLFSHLVWHRRLPAESICCLFVSIIYVCTYVCMLKGLKHEIFTFWLFSWIDSPNALVSQYNIFLIFAAISWRYFWILMHFLGLDSWNPESEKMILRWSYVFILNVHKPKHESTIIDSCICIMFYIVL